MKSLLLDKSTSNVFALVLAVGSPTVAIGLTEDEGVFATQLAQAAFSLET